MGLLDQFLGNADQTQALGLLGAHLMAGNAPGGFQAAQSLLADAPRRRMQEELLRAQIGETQAQAQERAMKLQREQEAMALAQRKQAALPGLFGGGEPQGGSMPGAMPEGAAQPQFGQFNVQAAIKAGFSPKEIMEYAALRNANQDEVARVLTEQGPGGSKIEQQYDKFGRKVGGGIAGYVAPQLVNQGDRQTFVQPSAGVSLPMNMSFADRNAAANLALSRQRLALDAANGQAGKAPAGYRFKADGSLEAIPGGPADIKAGELGAKADQRAASVAASTENVLSAVKDARSMVGPTTAGLGASLANIPGTPALNLSAKLETIKANLGFDRLQQMRSESPTGGALGAVAVQELVALQSTVASLDQKQSPKQLQQSLDKIEKHYKRWNEVVQQSKGGTGGAGGGWGIQKVN